MKLLYQLITELLIVGITLFIGAKVIGDMDYNIKLKKSYFIAFIIHPIRYIINNGQEIGVQLK